jgi:hypothetical protein
LRKEGVTGRKGEGENKILKLSGEESTKQEQLLLLPSIKRRICLEIILKLPSTIW